MASLLFVNHLFHCLFSTIDGGRMRGAGARTWAHHPTSQPICRCCQKRCGQLCSTLSHDDDRCRLRNAQVTAKDHQAPTRMSDGALPPWWIVVFCQCHGYCCRGGGGGCPSSLCVPSSNNGREGMSINVCHTFVTVSVMGGSSNDGGYDARWRPPPQADGQRSVPTMVDGPSWGARVDIDGALVVSHSPCIAG